MALPLDKLNKLLRTAALGVEVVQTAAKGRGIVATRAHRAGAAVVPAGEALAHSSKRAVNAFAGHGDFSAYERAWRRARDKLGADGRRHPLLIAQIASRVAHEPEASPYVLAVAALCSAKMTGPTPGPWVEDCASVKRALGGDEGDRYDFLTEQWYAGVASRIHLNALRADAEGTTVGLYAIPSFLNHHWEPNLLVDYGDDDVVFRAARPVDAGDELTIDYIYSLPQDERSAYLTENYGFDEASEIGSVSL
jgi:hypothetical protein